jgi:hypothetical protein
MPCVLDSHANSTNHGSGMFMLFYAILLTSRSDFDGSASSSSSLKGLDVRRSMTESCDAIAPFCPTQ